MVLWALTGRRFGLCTVQVRPCKPDPTCPLGLSDLIYWDRGARGLGNLGVQVGGTTPLLIDGVPFNISCGCPISCCTCKADCEILLPGPVYDITEVKIGSTVLDPSAYKLFNHEKLVILSGTDCPDCQDYNLPLGMDGTWSVTYRIGEPLPPGANMVAGLYACELSRAAARDTSCGLPIGARALVAGDVPLDLLDPILLAQNGMTGVRVVDDWIKAVNPYQMASRPRVWSPDLPVVRRET